MAIGIIDIHIAPGRQSTDSNRLLELHIVFRRIHYLKGILVIESICRAVRMGSPCLCDSETKSCHEHQYEKKNGFPHRSFHLYYLPSNGPVQKPFLGLGSLIRVNRERFPNGKIPSNGKTSILPGDDPGKVCRALSYVQ